MEIWGYIAGILGGIVLLGNVGVVIGRWLKPAMEVKKDVERHDADIKKLQEHQNDDFQTLEHLQEMNKLQMRAMLGLINHQIDGNGIEQMKATREELQDLLIKL